MDNLIFCYKVPRAIQKLNMDECVWPDGLDGEGSNHYNICH